MCISKMNISFFFTNTCVLKANNFYISIAKNKKIKLLTTFTDECVFNVYSTSKESQDVNKLVIIKHSIYDFKITNNPVIIAYHHYNTDTNKLNFEEKNKHELKLIYDIYTSRQVLLDKYKRVVSSNTLYRYWDEDKYDIYYYKLDLVNKNLIISNMFIPFIYKRVVYLQINKKSLLENEQIFLLESTGQFECNNCFYLYIQGKKVNDKKLIIQQPLLIVNEHYDKSVNLPGYFQELREMYSIKLIYSLDGKVLCYSGDLNNFDVTKFYFKIREENDDQIIFCYGLKEEYDYFRQKYIISKLLQDAIKSNNEY